MTKGFLRFITKIFLLLQFSFGLLTPGIAAAFQDVPSSDPIFPAVRFFIERGVIEEQKFFSGQKLIKKGEFHRLVWNSAGFKAKKGVKAVTKFQDLSSSGTYAPYAKKSLETKVITFDPKKPFYEAEKSVTRAEALQFIFDVKGIGITKVFEKKDIPFKDVHPRSNIAPLAKTAIELGLLKNEKKFDANKKITKAEVIQLLYEVEQAFIGKKSVNGTPVQIIQIQTEPKVVIGEKDGEEFIKNDKYPLLIDVWKKLRDKYVEKEKFTDSELMYGAIEGMVKKVDDPYTVFQEPQIATIFNQSLSGEFEGIGISIDMIEGKVVIVSPIRESPAEKAGLKPNDIIIKIDDKNIEGMKLEEVATLIKGPKGTKVKIALLRSGKELDFEIIREKIKIKEVDGYMKNGVAVIELHSFNQNSDQEFVKILKDLIAQNPKGIVFDLRNNPGGYLDTSLRILDHFFEKSEILSTLIFASAESAKSTFDQANKESERVSMPTETEIRYVSKGPATFKNYPLIILQNKGSASASEIVTAALQETGKVKIVGENSFGKGSVQELNNYSDGSQFKLTIAKWLTPKGVNLINNPIKPDVMVKDDPETEKDEMLEKAVELLQ